MNSLSPLLALWGYKNWPPSMKLGLLVDFYLRHCLKFRTDNVIGCIWPNATNHLISSKFVKMADFIPYEQGSKQSCNNHKCHDLAKCSVSQKERYLISISNNVINVSFTKTDEAPCGKAIFFWEALPTPVLISKYSKQSERNRSDLD